MNPELETKPKRHLRILNQMALDHPLLRWVMLMDCALALFGYTFV